MFDLPVFYGHGRPVFDGRPVVDQSRLEAARPGLGDPPGGLPGRFGRPALPSSPTPTR
jgi:hypothetical protein